MGNIASAIIFRAIVLTEIFAPAMVIAIAANVYVTPDGKEVTAIAGQPTKLAFLLVAEMCVRVMVFAIAAAASVQLTRTEDIVKIVRRVLVGAMNLHPAFNVKSLRPDLTRLTTKQFAIANARIPSLRKKRFKWRRHPKGNVLTRTKKNVR